MWLDAISNLSLNDFYQQLREFKTAIIYLQGWEDQKQVWNWTHHLIKAINNNLYQSLSDKTIILYNNHVVDFQGLASGSKIYQLNFDHLSLAKANQSEMTIPIKQVLNLDFNIGLLNEQLKNIEIDQSDTLNALNIVTNKVLNTKQLKKAFAKHLFASFDHWLGQLEPVDKKAITTHFVYHQSSPHITNVVKNKIGIIFDYEAVANLTSVFKKANVNKIIIIGFAGKICQLGWGTYYVLALLLDQDR